MEWGYTHRIWWKDEIGILVFAIPNKLPNTIKWHELDGNEWTKVTTISRKCNKTDGLKYLYYLNKYNFISGNMVANIHELHKLPATFIVKPHPKPRMQIASKSHNADHYLEKHLVACYYFSKGGLAIIILARDQSNA
jgi:hypothetical protein